MQRTDHSFLSMLRNRFFAKALFLLVTIFKSAIFRSAKLIIEGGAYFNAYT